MNSTAIQAASGPDAQIMESVLLAGDLSRLTAAQRVTYYQRTCESLGLNPLTRPFDFITLNGKMVLYAKKDAADQLRNRHNISIEKPDIQFQDDWIIVTVTARDANGRTDSDIAAVKKTDMQGNFGNALMKAMTKAKRRVTLSICGLGMLDETEVETIPGARTIPADPMTGEVVGLPELKPLTLEEAKAVTVKVRGADKAIGDMNPTQLNWVIENVAEPKAVEAAAMCLKQEHYAPPAE